MLRYLHFMDDFMGEGIFIEPLPPFIVMVPEDFFANGLVFAIRTKQ